MTHKWGLKALIAYIKLGGFESTSALLESIPPTMFSEILHCIDPIYFITRYQNLYQEVSPARAYALGIMKLVDEDGYYKFCTQFLHHAINILNRRSQHFPLSLLDYKYLLKCARATGNSSAATAI
jgi:hypothetical protein